MSIRFLLPEVVELKCIPRGSEFDNYVKQGKPWVARNAIDSSSRQPLTIDALRKSCADWLLTLFKDKQIYKIGLGEYIDHLDSDSTEGYYASQQEIPKPVQDIVAKYPLPPSQFPTNFWLGRSGVRTGLHRDIYHNVVTQLDGKKQFILHSPIDNRNVYIQQVSSTAGNKSPISSSKIDVDLTKFPRYRDSTPIKIILKAGDSLYIPPYWWHQADALTNNVMINKWWRPSLNLFAAADFQEMHNNSQAVIAALIHSADLQGFEDDCAVASWLNSAGLSLVSILLLGGVISELLGCMALAASIKLPIGNSYSPMVFSILQMRKVITESQVQLCRDVENQVSVANLRIGQEFPDFHDVEPLIERVRRFHAETKIVRCSPVCDQNKVMTALPTNTYSRMPPGAPRFKFKC